MRHCAYWYPHLRAPDAGHAHLHSTKAVKQTIHIPHASLWRCPNDTHVTSMDSFWEDEVHSTWGMGPLSLLCTPPCYPAHGDICMCNKSKHCTFHGADGGTNMGWQYTACCCIAPQGEVAVHSRSLCCPRGGMAVPDTALRGEWQYTAGPCTARTSTGWGWLGPTVRGTGSAAHWTGCSR